MKSLKSFIEKLEKHEKLPQKLDYSGSLENLEISITNLLIPTLLSLDIEKEQAEEFSEKVTKLVKSEIFVDHISEEIGVPLENETEDEFVHRGLQIIRKAIDKSLK